MAENKAKLILLDGSGNPGEAIDVQFNPEKYEKSWGLEWEIRGRTSQWKKTTPGNFMITLLFDTYEKQEDVTTLTEKIVSLIDPSQGDRQGCLFQWGKNTYKGIVSSIKEEFILFLADGTPVRSNVTITLTPWPETILEGSV
jgi:hypothetical protein